MDLEREVSTICSQLIEASKNSNSLCTEIANGLKEVAKIVSLRLNRTLDNIENTASLSQPSITNPKLKGQYPQPGRPKNSSKPVPRLQSVSEVITNNGKRKYHCTNDCGYGPYASSSALSYHKKSCAGKETLD